MSILSLWASDFPAGHIQVGQQQLYVQLASTPQQLTRGLMQRTSLQPYDGMLFLFSPPQPVAFWMKDTPLALDVGYFDAQGILREIYPMAPLDTTPIPSQHTDVAYALELPLGSFAARGLQPGDKLLILSDKQKE
jgi:uncharacterized protein